MLRSGACTGGLRTHQSIEDGTLPSIWRWGHLSLSVYLCRGGKVPMETGAVSQDVPLLGILCRSAPPVHNGSKLRM
jgi:hypothetical protein